jgi:hypothetical protein
MLRQRGDYLHEYFTEKNHKCLSKIFPLSMSINPSKNIYILIFIAELSKEKITVF